MIAAIPAFVVAAAAAATHEKKTGLPQLNPADFSPQLIWLALTFVVLYLILARVALPRIGEVLDERRDRVQRDLDAAERFKTDTDAALAAYEKALSDAHGKASSMAKDVRDKLDDGGEQGARAAWRASLPRSWPRPRGASPPPRLRRCRASNDIAAETASAVVGKLLGEDGKPRRGQEDAAARGRVRTSMLLDPADPVFWVMIAFFAFIGLLVYYSVPGMIGKALDARADAIRKELDEARRLRDEAQALLADYQRKSREAENEAKEILEQAKREAEALAAQTRKALAETVERRTKSAEDKIARAEAQALAEVRSSAVDSAIAAAEKILKSRASAVRRPPSWLSSAFAISAAS